MFRGGGSGHGGNGQGIKKQQGKKNAKTNGGNGNGKNQNQNRNQNQGQHDSQSRPRNVPPWPANKPYLSSTGNKISQECELHFRRFCYRCGLSNHRAKQCRIYPQRTAVLTLCTTCYAGFHSTCKNPKYKGADSTPSVNAIAGNPFPYGFFPFPVPPYMGAPQPPLAIPHSPKSKSPKVSAPPSTVHSEDEDTE